MGADHAHDKASLGKRRVARLHKEVVSTLCPVDATKRMGTHVINSSEYCAIRLCSA